MCYILYILCFTQIPLLSSWLSGISYTVATNNNHKTFTIVLLCGYGCCTSVILFIFHRYQWSSNSPENPMKLTFSKITNCTT